MKVINNIINKIHAWWDQLDDTEQYDLKKVGLISLIAVPVSVIATGLLLPYVYPALAAWSFGIGAACALAYLVTVFIQIVAPIILNHYQPTVEAVSSAAPSMELVSQIALTSEQTSKFVDSGPVFQTTSEHTYITNKQ